MRLLFMFIITMAANNLSAQNVGIGTVSPNASAMLDIVSNNKGMLVPRMTLLQRGAIISPAIGLLVFDTDINSFFYYNGSGWSNLSAGTGWSLTGNSGTNPATNFIGTIDDQPLIFKINNSQAGRISNTGGNTFLGYQSGNTNTTGYDNTANGIRSLSSNTLGYYNTAIGSGSSHSNTTGNNNTAIGSGSLYSNTTGSRNTANGSESLLWNTTGAYNTAIGSGSLYSNTTGSNNTANGSETLLSNTTGFDNTANGFRSLFSNTLGYYNTANGDGSLYSNSTGFDNTANGLSSLFSNTTGYDNTANGFKSLLWNTTGDRNTANGSESLHANITGYGNTANGYKSLYSNTTGVANTAIGWGSLNSNTTGYLNTALGQFADVSSGELTYATAIGAHAIVGASNSLVLGGTGDAAVKVGIGVEVPIVELHVKGSANFFSGATTHTGNFYAGTSDVDGIEMVSSDNDAYASIQRTVGYNLHLSKKNTTGGKGFIGLFVNGVTVGAIETKDGHAIFGDVSDKRLKENIVVTHYGLNTLLKINVADYNYKADSKKKLQTGFIAQELYQFYPQAVQTGGDNEKTNPWMVDYSKLTPLLVKSIQEQQQIIEAQKNDIEILKSQVAEMMNTIKKLTK